MIEFKDIELEDRAWMMPLIQIADMGGCHQNFTNLLAWSKINKKKVARINDFVVIKVGVGTKSPIYFYPAGEGDIKPVIEQMHQDAIDNGHEFIMDGLSPENITELKNIFPKKFKYKKIRDNFDYVYLIDKMISLSGKKLSSKRNHINNFKRNNQWSFELIDQTNIRECWHMNKEWCDINNCQDNEDLIDEACAVRTCLKNFDELELEGGLIRANDKVVAYTVGEILNSNTYVIHIEKAFSHIQGAYPMINREFAEAIKQKHPHIIYINREEDVGDLGLRKAKKSYYPDKMEEKSIAKYIGD